MIKEMIGAPQKPSLEAGTMVAALETVAAIEALREEDGAAVTILCDDENATTVNEQCGIDVMGAWTDWKERRFYGRTVLAALKAAVTAMKEKK